MPLIRRPSPPDDIVAVEQLRTRRSAPHPNAARQPQTSPVAPTFLKVHPKMGTRAPTTAWWAGVWQLHLRQVQLLRPC